MLGAACWVLTAACQLLLWSSAAELMLEMCVGFWVDSGWILGGFWVDSGWIPCGGSLRQTEGRGRPV